MMINAGEFLSRRALLNPNREGLAVGERRWTFRELNRRANRLAHAMKASGVHSGDRVGIVAYNGVEHFDLLFGLAKIGAILVPINHRLAPPEMASIFEDSGIDVLVLDPDFEDPVNRTGPGRYRRVYIGDEPRDGEAYNQLLESAADHEPVLQAGDDDALVLLYTIWSTGKPRGVVLTHENLFWSAASTVATLQQVGHTFLLPLPLFHIGSLGWLPFFMHRGSRCVLMPRFDPDRFLKLIRDEKVTAFGAVPTMLSLIRESDRFPRADFSVLRGIFAYGSAVPVELIREYAESNVRVRQLYGLTESAGPALVIDYEHALSKAGSCGLPFFHTRIKLVDHGGYEAPPGEPGEILIQGRHIMKGYWNQPEATGDALRGGWLYTGDLARQDPDGYYYIVDRKKELIISGGENIFPAEVETVLFKHPEIADAAVIGTPDRVWGETVKALVVKKSDSALTEADLIEWCKGKIAGYKIPRRVAFIDALPRTGTGKLEKKKLRP